ncbi:hypothetical protein AYI69_g2040 [Smittium culicis]|uniref:Uncharacterized protein n=1 Tax=Smittium culicis TaxID=133412 RepID=A0A1R1YNJ3_9FUNG|nr:hypothetical protein AYI69_g2040 [Smittium culicis]
MVSFGRGTELSPNNIESTFPIPKKSSSKKFPQTMVFDERHVTECKYNDSEFIKVVLQDMSSRGKYPITVWS